MSTRAGWSVLFAVLFAVAVVGFMTWWGNGFDRSWKALAVVGGAAAGAFASSCVDRVREWREAQRNAEGVAELPYPPNPAGLLRADQRIVPFTGRDDEYRELREWCRDDKSPVRLIVGAGGVGKTRLALELGDYQKSVGWLVKVVAAGREADALTTLRAATKHSSILLIVDYAETRTRTGLGELLRSVAGHPAHVRVLLIARSAGDWWQQLGSDEPAVRALVQAHDPLRLLAQVDSVRSPAELVREAVPYFAAARGVPVPKIEITVPDEMPLLALHAAALVAVLRSQDQRASAGELVADLGVLRELLGHESRFWLQSAKQATLGLDLVVLQRAVAVACLFGAVSESDGAEILRRVPDLRDSESSRRLAVARWLKQLYPSGSGYWGPLQPELVAEAHVIEQLKECPELVMDDLPELRPEQARQMLTVLSRGATHQPAGQALLEQALRADLERRVLPALEVAKVTGGALGRVLVQVLSTARVTPTMLRAIQAAIPYPTTALAETAVVVTRRILDTLPTDADIAETARWQLRLGIVLAQAGRVDEALPHIDTAVRHYRTLVETDRDRYLPELARSLHHLGIRHAEQGRHADALPHTKQAVEYYRELVEHDPGHHQADLAASLSNLGLWLAELGAHTAALEPLNEAVEHYWELDKTNPDRYRRDLAQALTNQRLSQSKVPPRPLSRLKEDVESNRALVETDLDRYLPNLAQSLLDLGNGYAEQKRYTDAVDQLTEALSYYRTLSESLERYRPNLAACLNNLGFNLTELDRYAEALPHAQKAVGLHRYLTKINSARYRPELARSLDNLVVCLSKMGRHLEVLPHAKEAVDVHKDLTRIDSDRYRPELARALDNYGVSLSELRRHSQALPYSREAVTIYWDLIEIDRHQYLPLLVQAQHNLAVDYSGLSRNVEADRCRQEADALSSGEAAL